MMQTVSRRLAAKCLGTSSLAFALPRIATPDRIVAAQEPANWIAGEFVGTIAVDDGQPDILVALIADPPTEAWAPRMVRAYFCNGTSIAEWFAGEIDGIDISMTTNSGATLEARLSEDGVGGRVSPVDGGSHTFVMQRAAGVEGLFHLTQSELGSFGASSRGVLWQYGV